MLAGFERARERYEAAIRQPLGEGSAMVPLFESLNWVDALMERLYRERGGGWSAGVLPAESNWVAALDEATPGDFRLAFTFARNRVHHHWPDALESSSGAAFPMRFPIVFHEWRWRQNLSARPGDKARNEGLDQYRRFFAGSPARTALEYARELLHGAIWPTSP